MKDRHSLYFFFLFSFPLLCLSQEIQTIKFSKSQFYFFQKGAKDDTLIDGKNNLFYLIIPDSLKPNLIVNIENGKLVATKNDSLVALDFLQGLKYESRYTLRNEDIPIEKKRMSGSKNKHYDFVSLINGVAATPSKKILIRLVNKIDNTILLENVFYIKTN